MYNKENINKQNAPYIFIELAILASEPNNIINEETTLSLAKIPVINDVVIL